MSGLDERTMTLMKENIANIPSELMQMFDTLFQISYKEAMIYMSLLMYDGLSARELAEITDIPRTRVYVYIKTLVSHGFVEERMAKNLTLYFATDPLLVQSRFVDLWQRNLEEKSALLERLVYQVIGYWDNHIASAPQKVSSVISSMPELFSLMKIARTRVWICAKGDGGKMNWRETAPLLTSLVENGVDVQFIVDKPLLPNVLKSYFLSVSSHGHRIGISYAEKIPHHFVIVDTVLFVIKLTNSGVLINRFDDPDISRTYFMLAESLIHQHQT